MANEQFLAPQVMWAQRKNLLTLTICVEDCPEPTITLEPTKVYFKGSGGPDKKTYEVSIDLYKEIDTENSKYYVKDRSIDFFLRKKEEGPYWPQLFKEKKKVHWLKVDFNRWRDEDDSEPEGENEEQDINEMMRKMGGLGGGDEKFDLNDLEGSEEEDDDDLPDLEN